MSLLDAASIAARRVLVVSPHPDDESLGCGGLIWSLAGRGALFHVLFVTDGGASHPGSRLWPRPRLAAQREAEAVEALRRLGIGEAARTFLRLPDADMPPPGSPGFDAAADAVAGILDAFRPDLALLPWRRDPHRDHRDAFALASAALDRASPDCARLEYAIWLDELGAPEDHPRAGEAERIAFDVSAAQAAKRAAVAAHLSQTSDLVPDDPHAFRLTGATIDRLTGPSETYWRSAS
ncbi:PIG-L deacetylase family protein [Antarcticirhabdus aurantiaca]|uniref:PIG-L family deacetylase n=1 Tax=Antarcticirhabdus aurantiaca TaxID=2606717 RepID=A0ACD4NMM5_9HYPH|nr:PIG-L family deacetylase [Antarcticirhabdus aurantiaca]WAJ27997.1 PIG-L family deacetylase [Jeongeuplla avenae]